MDDELSCSLSLTDSGQETDEFELVESDGEDSHWDAASTRSMSVLPSAYTYEYAHGRRYHGYSSGKYPLPNDKLEQQREEAVHAMMLELTVRRSRMLNAWKRARLEVRRPKLIAAVGRTAFLLGRWRISTKNHRHWHGDW